MLPHPPRWISWFCGLGGNEYFCEVAKEWIEDGFNLYGLRQQIGARYDDCLDLILDRYQAPNEADSSATISASGMGGDGRGGLQGDRDMMQSASILYGLIHARCRPALCLCVTCRAIHTPRPFDCDEIKN